MYHAKTKRYGITRVVDFARFAINQNLAFICRIKPVEDIHNGRLASAVLTDNGVNGLLWDSKADGIVGDNCAKAFGDLTHFNCVLRRLVHKALKRKKVNTTVEAGVMIMDCGRDVKVRISKKMDE